MITIRREFLINRSEKENLRKQMALLSKVSETATDSALSDMSIAMCQIDERLNIHNSRFIVFLVVMFINLEVSFFVLIKKFFRT